MTMMMMMNFKANSKPSKQKCVKIELVSTEETQHKEAEEAFKSMGTPAKKRSKSLH